VLVDGADVEMGEALGPGTQQFDRRVVTESKKQFKRLLLWDGGSVDNDVQLALLGAAGEGGTLFTREPTSGGTLHGGSRVTSVSETNE
jgi:hypothetical protein